MKKLVTLSAIAMAGATLGVGSTFGWWSDGSDEDVEKTKVKAADKASGDSSPAGLLTITLGEDDGLVAGSELKVIKANKEGATENVLILQDQPAGGEDRKSEARHTRIVRVASPMSAVEKLAGKLETEADQLESIGKKEAAELQRKLAHRLRETIKAERQAVLMHEHMVPHLKAHTAPHIDQHIKAHLDQHVRPHVNVEFEKSTPAGSADWKARFEKLHDMAVREKDRDAREKIKGEFRDVKLKAEAEFQAARKDTEAQIREFKAQVERLALEHQSADKSKQAAEIQQLRDRDRLIQKVQSFDVALAQKMKTGHLDEAIRELREVVETLETEGRKEEANAVRKQAEHIQRSISEQPIRVEIEAVPHIEHRYVIRKKGPESKDDDERGEHGRKEGKALSDRVHVGHGMRDGGPQMGEIHKILHELRHEIGELRDEVRGLRKQLGTEHRARKAESDEDNDRDDDDEAKEDSDEDDGEAKEKMEAEEQAEDDGDRNGKVEDRDDDDDKENSADERDDDDAEKDEKKDDKDEDRKEETT